MADFTELLRTLPIDQFASALGEDRETTYQAAAAAIPTLLAGMRANSADEGGAQSLVTALQQHQPESDEVPGLESVNVEDGRKVVRNVFGENTDAVVNQFGGMGFSSGLVAKLLPMLAPFVLGWLSKNIFGTGQAKQAPAQQESRGGGLGDLLGGILGGGRSEPQAQAQAPAPSPSPRGGLPGGININDILGDLLGGADASSSAPQGQSQQSPLPGGLSLDDLLGGLGDLLGGGRR
nr:DUF937 domain-containing protein [Actinomycetales bacterium]